MSKYKARLGAKFNNVTANVYGKEIERLMRKNRGELTSVEIVESARSRRSPLHKYFTWDDMEASQKYRVQEARNLISGIVEVVIIEEKKTEQRSFFNVRNVLKQQVYVSLQEALDTPDYRQQLLDKIVSHLQNTTTLMKMFRDNL